MTVAAAKHFEKHLAKDSNNIEIYVGTKLMGCSGLAYDIYFVTQQPADTTVVDQQELRFFVSINDMNFLNGLRIDYVKHDFGLYKLEYTNPNESAHCGCGESFTV
ncbi:HesB/IscA family protein [Francisella noatunensis]